MEYITNLLKVDDSYAWVIQVFIVIFATLIAGYLASRTTNKIQEKFKKTKNIWDDALLIALNRPIHVMILILGLTFAVEIIYTESKVTIFSAIYPIRDIAVIANISWFVIRFIKQTQNNIIEKRTGEVDHTTIYAISKILRASIIITASLIILQTLGFSVSGVLAFGGVGGVAIGFAAKDLLANFFGALMIYFDKPFKIGDWIRSPDKEIEGTVEDIGWRQTRIRTFDKRPLYVPNASFSTIAVENPSRMTHRRIKETIGVRYEDVNKLDNIIKSVKDMLISHEEIDDKQTLIVNVNSFAPSSVDFLVYTFTHTTNWIKFHSIKQDVMLKIAQIIEDNNAEIAFPTSTLHIADEVNIKN